MAAKKFGGSLFTPTTYGISLNSSHKNEITRSWSIRVTSYLTLRQGFHAALLQKGMAGKSHHQNHLM